MTRLARAMPPLPLIAAFMILARVALGAEPAREWRQLPQPSPQPRLEYAVVRPEGFDAARAYPVLLALPPGAQDRAMVDSALDLYFAREGAASGWIVVCPAAPGAQNFADRGHEALPALVESLRKEFRVEGVHLAGVSNGGRGAFRAAARRPDLYASLTLLPGAPPAAEDLDALAGVRTLPVWMLVGELDPSWLQDAKAAHERLKSLHQFVRLDVLPNQEHRLEITPQRLLSVLESQRHASKSLAAAPEVARVLDAFHAAAAKGDGEAYFALLHDDGVFIGTDASERWTKPQFRAWADDAGYLKNGKGWSYTPRDRNVSFSRDLNTAWFDELLDNAKYGECRGTGVLLRDRGAWTITQYSLSLPIPNEVTLRVGEVIRSAKKPR